MKKINFTLLIIKSSRVLLFSVVLSLAVSVSAFAATYYVATNGVDNSGCGADSSECASIQYVLSSKVNAGDTIKVKAGTYKMSSAVLLSNTTTHDNITITADDQGNRPLLNFSSIGQPNLRIYQGVTGVTISYIRIQDGSARLTAGGVSIRIDDNPSTIDHVEVFNCMSGIGIVTGKRVTVSNSVVHTCGKIETNPDVATGGGSGIVVYNWNNSPVAANWNEKIYIYNNEVYDVAEDGFIPVNVNYKYIEVAYNNFHDNYEDGIDLKDVQFVRIHHNTLNNNWGNGIGTPKAEYAKDIEIYSNEIYNNGWYGIVASNANPGPKERWVIFNNLIYSNCQKPAYYGCNGITLVGPGHEFYYNVVYNNSIPANAQNSGASSNSGITGSGIIKNNIFYNNAPNKKGNITAGGTIDNNYVYPTSPGTTGTNAVTVSDPLFVNLAGSNFTLQSGSQLINAGVNVGITSDYAGNLRPIGSGYDIGAYEFDGVQGDTLAPDPPANLQIVLN